jgi:1,4-alpha-glucan branching enzyme
MIHKTFVEIEGKLVARVTFSLPDSIWADHITLVGDFNSWDTESHPFGRTEAGTWFVTVELLPHRAYQFRYLRDKDQWINDRDADAHVHNIYGSDNFVVITDPAYKRYVDERK